MPRRCITRILAAATSLGVAALLCGPASGAGGQVTERAVTFDVSNTNRSALPCPTDGAAYPLKGRLIGPASKLGTHGSGSRRSVTLYVHGFSLGGSFWNLRAVPRYDYAAAMARAGHVSLVVDRLGYSASGRPAGNATCLGAAADVAHQVVGKLRAGDYAVDASRPVQFERVALAGHSAGGLIANIEAISFGDADALAVMSYTPQVTLQAFGYFYAARALCDAGGDPATPAGPGAYAYFGQTEAEFLAGAFHSADPAVRDAVLGLRSRDPCGDTASIVGGLVRDLKSLSQVKAPVLVVCGREDAMTPEFACPFLKRRYTGSRDVSLALVRRAGHALPLERTAPAFRRRVSTWLKAHGF